MNATIKIPAINKTMKTEELALATIVARLYQPLKKFTKMAITIMMPAGALANARLNIFFCFSRSLPKLFYTNFVSAPRTCQTDR